MRSIELQPVAFVKNARIQIEDDNWADVLSEIILQPSKRAKLFKTILLG